MRLNPLSPKGVLQILLCLMLDDFTCERETPYAKGLKADEAWNRKQSVSLSHI